MLSPSKKLAMSCCDGNMTTWRIRGCTVVWSQSELTHECIWCHCNLLEFIVPRLVRFFVRIRCLYECRSMHSISWHFDYTSCILTLCHYVGPSLAAHAFGYGCVVFPQSEFTYECIWFQEAIESSVRTATAFQWWMSCFVAVSINVLMHMQHISFNSGLDRVQRCCFFYCCRPMCLWMRWLDCVHGARCFNLK